MIVLKPIHDHLCFRSLDGISVAICPSAVDRDAGVGIAKTLLATVLAVADLLCTVILSIDRASSIAATDPWE